MQLNQFLEFKFGSSSPDEIANDPMFRDIKWDTKSVVLMIIHAYTAGAEHTLSRLNFKEVKHD